MHVAVLTNRPENVPIEKSVTSTGKKRAGAFQKRRPSAGSNSPSNASASPELVLVYLDDLALQFEGLFWKQLEVSDVV